MKLATATKKISQARARHARLRKALREVAGLRRLIYKLHLYDRSYLVNLFKQAASQTRKYKQPRRVDYPRHNIVGESTPARSKPN